MRGLGTWAAGRIARPWSLRDRGSVTMITVSVVATGSLLGVGAVVIDVGQLYQERQELQSGADAAAQAVAKLCASGTCTDPVATARRYANANAKDSAANVAVCGAGITSLPACTTTTSTRLTACIGATSASRYVQVVTTTRNADDTTMLPPSLARGLAGNDNYQGTTVQACARAKVTPGMTGRVWQAGMINLAFNVCYWSMYTTNGNNYRGTPTAPPSAAYEQILYIKDSRPNGSGQYNGTTYCPGAGSANAPGNWGWLDDATSPTGDCRSVVTTGNSPTGDNGNNTPAGCVSLLSSVRAAHAPIMIPLFDSASGQGSHVTYHIAGVAAFVVTGYFLTGGPSNRATSWISGVNPCSGSERCISGYFVSTNFYSDVIRTENGTDFGANTSQPATVSMDG